PADVPATKGTPCSADTDPCTVDACDGAGRCNDCGGNLPCPPGGQKQPNCNPSNSAAAVVGGPNDRCDAPATVVGTNCVLKTPMVCANDATRVCTRSADCVNDSPCGQSVDL